MTVPHLSWLAITAFAAGAVNAIAGGGSLLTFPALLAAGLPPVLANVTNTVALAPGYVGAVYSQRRELRGQAPRLRRLLLAAALGGLVGGELLLHSSERLFTALVPWLIGSGSILLALQEPLRRRLQAFHQHRDHRSAERWAMLPVGLASVYGGYFGAGWSVILLALLAITLDDSLTRLNGLKQALALACNLAAAGLFLVVARVALAPALVMAVSAVAGGAVGGRLASRINARALRTLVVLVGLIVAVLLWRR